MQEAMGAAGAHERAQALLARSEELAQRGREAYNAGDKATPEALRAESQSALLGVVVAALGNGVVPPRG
jgi:hypothetical protein